VIVCEWFCTSDQSFGEAEPYDGVKPYSTWLSAGTAVVQLIVADEDVTLAEMPAIAGARLLTNIVAGSVMTVLPKSSCPTACTVCGPSVVEVVANVTLHEPEVMGVP